MRIAVDGPAGSGKSSISKIFAKKHGLVYLDSGAMYRAAAWFCLNYGIDKNNIAGFMTDTDFIFTENGSRLRLDFDFNGRKSVDVTDAIRSAEVTGFVSAVAAVPAVREVLTEKQRDIARSRDVIMDGRDIGTVVLPDAEVKFFLTASATERARRRALENGTPLTGEEFDKLLESIVKRDLADESRAVAPLKKASDAIEIDTTSLTMDEVIAIMEVAVKEHRSTVQVTIAENAGFCFGVERAINIVYDALDSYENVVTYGPIIHNPQVVDDLEKAGVRVINSIEEVEPDMTVIIRTHGVPLEVYQRLREVATIVDATCPFVKKVQDAAKKLSDESFYTVVVGEFDHPEVQSIVSHISGEYSVINSAEEARNIGYKTRCGAVAQTTQNSISYKEIVEELRISCGEIKVFNTICSATHNRQRSAKQLATEVDTMIIVGGRNSANTTRLYSLCKEICKNTYHIETVQDLTDDMLLGASLIGVTAGASTPSKLVDQVKEYILERANE